MTALVATAAVLGGYLASRVIVGVSDAHRLGRTAPGWVATCCVDGKDRLNWSMLRCTEGHPQRQSNALVIASTVGLFATMVFVLPSLWLWPAYAVFCSALVVLTVTDLDTMLIPNRILGPLTALGAVLLGIGWALASDSGSILRAVASGIGYFAVMYVLALVARGGLGFGDVKLAFLIGLFTGYLGWGVVLVAGIGSFIVGGLVSLILLVSRRRGRKDAIPFGPFMVIAAVIAVVWGSAIAEWYRT